MQRGGVGRAPVFLFAPGQLVGTDVALVVLGVLESERAIYCYCGPVAVTIGRRDRSFGIGGPRPATGGLAALG